MSNSSVITCVTWVRRGEALSLPQHTLKGDDLKEAAKKFADSLEEDEVKHWSSDSDDTDSEVDERRERAPTIREKRAASNKAEEEDLTGLEEYNFEDYDNDDKDNGDFPTNLESMAVFTDNKDDPYMTSLKDEEDEEEEEDFKLKDDDNLIIVGRTEEDGAILEVYVFNESEDSLYIHHEVLLPSFPLALEWLRPEKTQSANYVAVGYFTPTIDIWDLDVVDSLEPVLSLGKRKNSSKKAKSGNRHTDAVLDLSWSHNVSNVLASASADNTIALWDVTSQKMVSQFTHHTDKVQSVEWHPFEGRSLLTGGCDGLVAAIDCKSHKDAKKMWKVEGEVEKVVWNHFHPFQFFVSTDKGVVQGFDIRTDKRLFTLQAHSDAVTCMSLSHFADGCLATVSADQSCKLWSIQDNQPSLLVTKEPKMGIIHCVEFSPDSPLRIALGGARDSLRTIDFEKICGSTFTTKQHFASKQLEMNTESAER